MGAASDGPARVETTSPGVGKSTTGRTGHWKEGGH